MNIDVGLISRAIKFYGCKQMSVPYLVDPDIMEWTCPPGVIDHRLTHADGKQYVASAEQSFLQLEKEGQLDGFRGAMMALTPCYRDETVLDETHYNIFLKLEIFDYNTFAPKLDSMYWANRMVAFFAGEGLETEVLPTDLGYDVVTLQGLELGSFGHRISPKGISYVYATGLAEPRASIALQRSK